MSKEYPAEMHIGSRMIAGTYTVMPDKSGRKKWQFKYASDREAGIHVFKGFTTADDCRVNAKLMGVEFLKGKKK